MQVLSEIHRLPKNATVKFVALLWQVWILRKDGFVLVFDLQLKSWWKCQFNAEIIDVFTVGDKVYLVKSDRISKLDKGTFLDNGEYMKWKYC